MLLNPRGYDPLNVQRDTQHESTRIMNEQVSTEFRILVIDDNPRIHDDIRKALAPEVINRALTDAEDELFGPSAKTNEPTLRCQVDAADQGEEGLAMVRQAIRENRPYALAIVDMRMPPGWDGLTTTEELWKVAPDLQTVICTAYSEKSWSEIVSRLGHSDSLLILKKPFDDIEVSQLAVALTKKWQLTKDANARLDDLERLVSERTAQLTHVALHDSLTELPNRIKFQDRLRDSLRLAGGKRNSLAVLLVDIDHFKNINDSQGHPAGDEVLRAVARELSRSVRQTDTVARLGGDEFAIIQTIASDPQASASLARRIYQAFKTPILIEGKPVFVNVSIGIATAPVDGDQPELLLKNADLALYQAKADGRGCHRFFTSEMELKVKERREVEIRLRLAIQNEGFEIHYQPIFTTRTNEVCCLEALIRWRDLDGGLVMPGQFIDIAEDTGLINPLGSWALKKACFDAMQWPKNVRVAVNVSAIQFRNEYFIDSIVESLNASGLHPNRLEIEITESVLLRDCDETIAMLHRIRDLGVRVVMDDFGTGYSSLSYLKRFPFDKIKMDKSFVQDFESKDTIAIIRVVAYLGKCLGMETTAEGVETEKQLLGVLEEGFTQFQGYLRGRPQPAKEITRQFFPKPPAEFPKSDRWTCPK